MDRCLKATLADNWAPPTDYLYRLNFLNDLLYAVEYADICSLADDTTPHLAAQIYMKQ